jgi:thiol-disulfide isomerase/thioredoxin
MVIDTLKAMVKNHFGIKRIEKANDYYIAIENREFDKLVLKSSDNLADLSEGEALLKKILEPYKGKFVLLDIWGTWCGPCKEALSHSTEEYARLKDYDIQYLYLANESPQTSWENVIKEYNVSGPNVAHYNLPWEQQAAIERHLGVHSWPTYKLFNRDGNLLDLRADPRDLEGLADLLEQLK